MKHLHPLYSIACAFCLIMLSLACQSAEPEPETSAPESSDITDQLGPGADRETIVQHLLTAERSKRNTGALSMHYPDMERTYAYEIQQAILEEKEKVEKRIGWKIGYSRKASPDVTLDPIFGHIMASGLIEEGTMPSPSQFVNGTTVVEGEFAFWIASDLPGPEISREDVIAAVEAVGPVIELLAPWTAAAEGYQNTRNHDIAGNVFHVGLIPGKKFKLDEVDLTTETIRVEIDGEEKASGEAAWTMGKDPIEGLVWIANELVKYSPHHLRAGDIVITGTVLAPPPMGAGSTARMIYSTLGEVEFTMKNEDRPED